MKQLSEEKVKLSNTVGLLNEERTKTQDLKASVSRMNADICNYSDLKNHVKEHQTKIHEEKVRYAQLNDRNIKCIQNFESEIQQKNVEIDSVKQQLGNTINKLTNAECKIRDLDVSLGNSKDSLGKATLNITRLSDTLKDENARYGKLLEDSRKDRNVIKIN
jgi:chromosome segregation ATPase